ncbi:MAG: ROK family protein [Anaerolineales bacterium]
MLAEDRYRTGDQALVRQINLSVIMHRLRENAPVSRAQLAEMTGLNKTTVSSLVQELIDRQFVREVGLETSGSRRRVGRLAMMLTLNPEAGFIVSSEIGVDFVRVICTNFAPKIIWQRNERILSNTSQQQIIDHVLALMLNAEIEGRKFSNSFLGVSVGVPGLVDQNSGSLLFATNLKWSDVPLRQILEERFDAPVVVDNEASIAALGEYYYGAAQGYEEILYISAGVGLGGGIVHEGRMFNGVTGFGTEFGHMTMDPDGELCNCGNYGCWETQVSQEALFRYITKAISRGSFSSLTEKTKGDPELMTVPIVVEAANGGDELALEAFHEIGIYLGIGIASLVNILNPDLVVFGGILSLAADYLLPVINDILDQRALKWNRNATRVVSAQQGLDACVMGGVAKVYQAILAEPDNVELQVA